MIEKHYKCKLLSELVLNASLATEGNMESLDYISGSNFLGIVANDIYKNHKDQAKDILHSKKVLFGDGIISKEGKKFYAIPLCFLQDKLNSDLDKNPVYIDFNVNHLEGIEDEKTGKKLQLKQKRQGYISADGDYLSEVSKNFSLKSAYDRDERRSAEGKMFGMEAIQAGEVFFFTISYESEEFIETVEKYLLGQKRIGKSKSAEFGQVEISANDHQNFKSESESYGNYTIVYAESNLCFFDKNSGQPTFKPTAQQLGIENGDIDWEKSQIRTFSYSPWNSKRNASSMQRHCIKRGSVFYIKNGTFENSRNIVGDFTNEGLGRVFCNPIFLSSSSQDKQRVALNFSKFDKVEDEQNKHEVNYNQIQENHLKTSLGKILLRKAKNEAEELLLAEEINTQLTNKDNKDLIKQITSSQWGNIRALAIDHLESRKTFKDFLFELGLAEKENPKGILTHGKMSERLWNPSRRKRLKEIFKEVKTNRKLEFAAKFSAEMAKAVIDNKNKKDEHSK